MREVTLEGQLEIRQFVEPGHGWHEIETRTVLRAEGNVVVLESHREVRDFRKAYADRWLDAWEINPEQLLDLIRRNGIQRRA
jgi:hypothetical protein